MEIPVCVPTLARTCDDSIFESQAIIKYQRSSHAILLTDMADCSVVGVMVRLSDIAMVLTGLNPEPVRAIPSKFIQIKDLTRDRRALSRGERPTAARALPVEPPDVLVAARGERSLVVRPDDELIGAFVALDVYLIKPDVARLDPDYLTALLVRPAIGSRLRASTAGASLPRIPKEALAELELPLPDLRRQRAIGGLSVAIRRYRDQYDRLKAAEDRVYGCYLDRAFTQLQ